mmetsp:Transcript_71246/g.185758  ORF Transcript_71246/g.185758 Transcript_71246/m.185758 type:complete len:212 (-) Transcript_71246:118-753(-)
MPRCMFARALPTCSSVDPLPESSSSFGGNCALKSQYVRYASSGSPTAILTAAFANRNTAESSLDPCISATSFSAMPAWLHNRQNITQSACISNVGCALVSSAASFQLPSIAWATAASRVQLMSCVSFASERSRSLARFRCASCLDFSMIIMNTVARCPGYSEFCISLLLSRSTTLPERQQRASRAPSSLCAKSVEAVVPSAIASAFWKLPT